MSTENAWVFAFCHIEIAWICHRNRILANKSDFFVLQQFRIWRKCKVMFVSNSSFWIYK